MMGRFNGVELTAETMQLTRQHFAENAQACIDEVKRGEVRVNDPPVYFDECTRRAASSLAGDYDHTLTFQQRAHWLQTGECIALLP